VAKPVDDQHVWSITCFYIARSHRKRGLMTALIDAAGHGAGIVEVYPLEFARALDWGEGLVGIGGTAFIECGFSEVARRTPTRPVMCRAVAS